MPVINEGGASGSADGAPPQAGADAPPPVPHPGEAIVYLRDMVKIGQPVVLTEEEFVNFERGVRQTIGALLKALPVGAKG
eukprot:12897364-Heterocapsa_arctica.AAC.1